MIDSVLKIHLIFTQLICGNVNIAVTNTAVFQLERHVQVRRVVTLYLDLLEGGGGVRLSPGGGGVHGGEDCFVMTIRVALQSRYITSKSPGLALMNGRTYLLTLL